MTDEVLQMLAGLVVGIGLAWFAGVMRARTRRYCRACGHHAYMHEPNGCEAATWDPARHFAEAGPCGCRGVR